MKPSQPKIPPHAGNDNLDSLMNSGYSEEDVLQLRSSKQDKADLFYSKAFIYGPFSDVALALDGSKTVVATHVGANSSTVASEQDVGGRYFAP